MPGAGSRDRYYKLNVTSDTISLNGIASASGYMEPGDGGALNVMVAWTYSIYNTLPSGVTIADRKVVAAPWRNGPPMHGGNPRFQPIARWLLRGPDPVDLATGEHIYIPCADIEVYNPNGPGLSYQRNFLSKVAKDGYGSPGQSVGWVDTYDVRISANSPGTWGSLKLTYPNSATETLTPVLSGGAPTGQFTGPLGAEYFAVGIASGTTGQWQLISLTFKDQTMWTLTPTTTDNYALTQITNRMGRWVSINRDQSNGYRVATVSDDATPTANTLLSFSYNSGGYLQSVTDAYQRKVIYTYGPSAGATCLIAVSQIGASTASAIQRGLTATQHILIPPSLQTRLSLI